MQLSRGMSFFTSSERSFLARKWGMSVGIDGRVIDHNSIFLSLAPQGLVESLLYELLNETVVIKLFSAKFPGLSIFPGFLVEHHLDALTLHQRNFLGEIVRIFQAAVEHAGVVDPGIFRQNPFCFIALLEHRVGGAAEGAQECFRLDSMLTQVAARRGQAGDDE